MKNSIVRYGVIGGLVMMLIVFGAWLFFRDMYSYRTGEIIGYSSMMIALTSVFFAIRKYRDEVAAGTISFQQALKVGLLTTLIPAGFGFVQTVLFFFAFGSAFHEWAMASLKSTEPAYYAAYVEQMENAPEWMNNPFFQGVITFLTIFLIGSMVSIIAAMILQRKPKSH